MTSISLGTMCPFPCRGGARERDDPMGDEGWQTAWQLSIDLTVGKLQQADLQERCRKSGVVWHPESQAIDISLLSRNYRVTPPAFEATFSDSGEAAPITERIFILHYLETASGAPLSGKWITFAEVPGGDLYLPVFRARSIDRLVRAFTGREEVLIESSDALGGVEMDYGDVSVQLRALPHVPVALTLWRGDDEFSPSGNLLFDATVTEYLPMEDIVVLAEMVISRLLNK